MVGQERTSDLFLVFQERYGRKPKTVTYPHTQHHTESLIQIAFSVEPKHPRKTPPFRVKKRVCVSAASSFLKEARMHLFSMKKALKFELTFKFSPEKRQFCPFEFLHFRPSNSTQKIGSYSLD